MRLDERGKQCPLPVIETKRALEGAAAGEIIEVLADNEIAVQNLQKLAGHKGLACRAEKTAEGDFLVAITAAGGAAESGRTVDTASVRADSPAEPAVESALSVGTAESGRAAGIASARADSPAEPAAATGTASDVSGACTGGVCSGDSRRKGLVAVISSDKMGQGDDVLGTMLMKSFLYALAQQDQLPETILLYNGGARLSCEGAETVEDLKNLEAEGVEILTCGTCLNFYGLPDRLAVGGVTNMYEIAEKMTAASALVRP